MTQGSALTIVLDEFKSLQRWYFGCLVGAHGLSPRCPRACSLLRPRCGRYRSRLEYTLKYRARCFALGWPPGTRRDLRCYLHHPETILTHPTSPGLAELIRARAFPLEKRPPPLASLNVLIFVLNIYSKRRSHSQYNMVRSKLGILPFPFWFQI